jgi:N utilization substance protein B
MKRSRARMLALQALCAFEAVGERFDEQLDEFLADEEILSDLEIRRPPPAEILDFARVLAKGTWSQRAALDALLSRTTAHWTVGRMTPVDRNILRLGLHELHAHPDTPPQVVINEAIELARRFGDTDSPGFVNGVLDAVRRSSNEGGQSPSRDQQATSEETEDSNGAF